MSFPLTLVVWMEGGLGLGDLPGACVGSNHRVGGVPAELEGAPSRACLCMCILEMDFCGNVTIFHSCSTLVGERLVVGLTWGLLNEVFVEALSATGNCIRWVHCFLLWPKQQQLTQSKLNPSYKMICLCVPI